MPIGWTFKPAECGKAGVRPYFKHAHTHRPCLSPRFPVSKAAKWPLDKEKKPAGAIFRRNRPLCTP